MSAIEEEENEEEGQDGEVKRSPKVEYMSARRLSQKQ